MSMSWKIKYCSQKLENEILELPSGLLVRYLQHSDLFELRVKGKEGIARVFFCTRIGRNIIMLHSFIKKSQKTPGKEIEIARKRKKEVLEIESF